MQRCALVGTAESWRDCPWSDPGLQIISLNDAHSMKPPRADRWYDLHPLHHFVHPTENRRVFAHEVPAGYYVRPAHHLEWMTHQEIPIYLHPDWRTQEPTDARDKAAWEILKTRPNIHAFPRDAVKAHFGRYFTSSPARIMAHLIMEGCTELHIYGIHLSTEHEYIEQRPNFEFLIGRMLGSGPITETLHDGMRTYATSHGRIVLPKASPVLQADFEYAWEPRPRAALEPLRWEAHKVQIKRERIIDAFKRTPNAKSLTVHFAGEGPNGTDRIETMSSKAAQEQLWMLDALALDWQDQMARCGQRWGA